MVNLFIYRIDFGYIVVDIIVDDDIAGIGVVTVVKTTKRSSGRSQVSKQI